MRSFRHASKKSGQKSNHICREQLEILRLGHSPERQDLKTGPFSTGQGKERYSAMTLPGVGASTADAGKKFQFSHCQVGTRLDKGPISDVPAPRQASKAWTWGEINMQKGKGFCGLDG